MPMSASHRGRRMRRPAAVTLLALALSTAAPQARAHDEAVVPAAADPAAVAAARAAVVRANPALMQAITRGGAFGSEFSQAIANQMYSRTDAAAIADARARLKVEPQGERSWLLRLPFVNVAVFETDEGLVLIDSGYAPAGPVLREVLPTLSPKPIHTIVYTHYHADHAWGAWALQDRGPQGRPPRIVATRAFMDQMGEDLRSHGLVQRNNQQRTMPSRWDEVVAPTQLFERSETLRIGGEDFVLTHARGETEDQLWAWLPARRIVVSADYVQDFLPNAGNGKRRQRYVEDWAQALRQMAARQPLRLLPMHGPAMLDAAQIQDRLGAHAEALERIAQQVLAGLNAGLRVDQVVQAVRLPEALARRHDLRPDYVSVQDIARMVVKQYGGWWDDVPSHWNPAPLAEQARAIAALAGGVNALIERAQALAASQPAVAAALADWAWLAAPDDARVLRGAMAVYAARVGPDTSTQEALVYLEHLARLQLQLTALDAAPR